MNIFEFLRPLKNDRCYILCLSNLNNNFVIMYGNFKQIVITVSIIVDCHSLVSKVQPQYNVILTYELTLNDYSDNRQLNYFIDLLLYIIIVFV